MWAIYRGIWEWFLSTLIITKSKQAFNRSKWNHSIFFYEKQGHAVSGPYRWKVTFTNHKIISRISVYDLFHQSIFSAFFSIRFIQWLYSTEFGIFVLWHRTNHWRKIPFVDKLNIRLRYLRRCFLIKFFSCEQMQNSLDYISLKIKMENTWMLPTEE